MRRREVIAAIAGIASLAPVADLAQPQKVPTIGILVPGKEAEIGLRLFPKALRDLGYIDGKNIHLDIRSAEGDLTRLPALAAELVHQKVNVLVPWSTPAVLAAKHATREIPIVIMAAGDPVASGIVASLARPGGNITGMAAIDTETVGKQIELLKEAVSGLDRIAALLNEADPFFEQLLVRIKLAGKAQGADIVSMMVIAGPQLDAAFPAMLASKAGAAIIQPTLPLAHVADLALKYRLPASSSAGMFAAYGGLMAYTPRSKDLYRGAAALVDKVLKGARPADLPIEQPKRFDLIINLRTADALGLKLPPTLLARTDDVIE